MTYITAQPCVDILDRACVKKCPVDCTYEGKRMFCIHPDECVDYGTCEPIYPVGTVFYEGNVPDEWVEFIDVNVDRFDELGSPSGATKLGPQNSDVPFMVALPSQAED